MYNRICISDMNVMYIDIDIDVLCVCIHMYIRYAYMHVLCTHVYRELRCVVGVNLFCCGIQSPGIMGNSFGVSVQLDEEANTQQIAVIFCYWSSLSIVVKKLEA